MFFDWHQFHREEMPARSVVDPRRRLRLSLDGWVVLLAIIFGRGVQLEVTQGAAFRNEALQPLRRETPLPGVRGRIRARDGTVLAYDKKVLALAVYYRYLQESPDAAWLRQTARLRLPKAERKDARRLAAEIARLAQERIELGQRLARLCDMPPQQWQARAHEIQARVERIIAHVDRRRQSEAAANDATAEGPPPQSLAGRIQRAVWRVLRASFEEPSTVSGPVAEELEYHLMAEDVPAQVVAEIEGHPGGYPGVKIIERRRRAYCFDTLAAHVLGYVQDSGGQGDGLPSAGRAGVERQYERLLRGRDGVAVELTDHGGRILSSFHQREPAPGDDLVLSLDLPLQRTAEALLDSALERRALQPGQDEPAGGAIVVMDLQDGALRAAASAPRFDPNLFAGGDAARRAALLTARDHPLFDRVVQMALPPGSVFKTLTAVALLESATVAPQTAFTCQGYLHDPGQLRCAIYVRQGIGHGEVTLADALAQSCNVYFFHYAGQMGAGPLGDWALRLGFGQPTGVDLPGEASGTVPTPQSIRRLEGHGWRTADTQALAIGEGSLTATPLQVLRMTAAVATGKLFTPHVTEGKQHWQRQWSPPQVIDGLRGETLAAIRQGLERVVADPKGTAYGAVTLDSIAVAGKTGTAVTGPGRGDHAWFAGYAPAERPKVAFVVVLEHAGDSATAAGPVAKRLVLRMQQLGML
jgi:penicillin-binding protein 2